MISGNAAGRDGDPAAQETARGPGETTTPLGQRAKAPLGQRAKALLEDPRRDLLALVPGERRGWVVGSYCKAVRAGITAPQEIVRDVLGRLRERWAESGVQEILSAFRRHPDEAQGLALWALEWEQLSPAEKQAGREARRPVTERQLSYLHVLGYRGEIPDSLREASDLIASLLAQRGGG